MMTWLSARLSGSSGRRLPAAPLRRIAARLRHPDLRRSHLVFLQAVRRTGSGSATGRSGDWRVPVRRGYVVVAVVFGGCGLWSATARLDSAVAAQGSVVVESDRKAVQHLEGGLVRDILAHDGDLVRAGDVVVRLDVTQSLAQRSVAQLTLFQALGEEARMVAEAERLDAIAFPRELADAIDTVEARRTILDQGRQFAERRAARQLETSILQERLRQSRKQHDSVLPQREATAAQAASISDELKKLQPLADKGFVAANRINPLERSLIELRGKLGSFDADLQRLSAGIDEIRLQIDQVDRKTVEDASSRLTEVRARLAEAREKLRMTDDVLARAEIRAPRSGRIVGSRLHTIGAVVKSGETIMEVVPQDEDLVVAAKVSPIDVNSVHPGLPAEIRLPSFKGRSTPVAIGEVKWIGADALRDDATRQLSYELRVSVLSSAFPAELRGRLRPGMPAEVVIPIGERTVIAYLTQPLIDAMRVGMREP